MRIIRQYLLSEILGLFLLSLAVITIVFLSQRVIQLTEWAINRGVGVLEIGRLLVYLLPTLLLIIIPVVTLLSILLSIGRLSADNEIVALKAAGVSLYRLVPCVVLFAVLASVLCLFSSQVLAPRAMAASRDLRFRIVQSRTEAALAERAFFEFLPDTTFYVREKGSDGELRGVMAAMEKWPEDSTWENRQVIFARTARFVHDPGAFTNELWLFNGTLIQEDRPSGREDFINFETARLRLDLGPEVAKRDERLQSLDLAGMASALEGWQARGTRTDKDREELAKLKIQWHERFAFPLGCLALCFWAIPLGIQPPRTGRARAIVVSVILSATYYYLMILAKFAALYGWYETGPVIWTPDLLILVSGLYMLRQKNQERPIFLLTWLEEMLYYLGRQVREAIRRRSGK